jgi:NAD kinase
MKRLTENKIVLVTRPTRLAELVARFNTVTQARFYVEHLGADFSDYQQEDECYRRALADAQRALAQVGRMQVIDRGFLPNFLFAQDDTVVTLGQDGLVANTLKYLNGQPVVGVNPDPARWDGQLLPFNIRDLPKVLPEVLSRKRATKSVTMAKATLNNGQVIYGVNDLFIGPKTHVSARYTIRLGEAREQHSSSGVIVSTGLGSTGWLTSMLTGAATIAHNAGTARAREMLDELPLDDVRLPVSSKFKLTVQASVPWDSEFLFFTVREPFPSKTTTATLVFGKIKPAKPLVLVSQMPEHGVIFSDGIEKDFLEFNSGTQAVIEIAERKGQLVT